MKKQVSEVYLIKSNSEVYCINLIKSNPKPSGSSSKTPPLTSLRKRRTFFLKTIRFKLQDSTFNLASEEELQAGVKKVQNMLDAGTLDQWFAQKEEQRWKCGGQSVNCYGVKE
jgi:hypothetical protein